MVSAFVIIKNGRFLQWNGVDWTDDSENAAMFVELNDVFSWADMIEVDICGGGGRLERHEFTRQQFRSSLAKRS